ncbi:Kinesin-like protein KIN [Seminavis robusta]|uniref:Kinesin-like protein KIN n=1 Tax=Seminavis robusta TaxID=568900 RepID=A0A9N8H294_9STRA|nr:Kinesin-like protein KIN [Seminavis robusta]|eukprot:Sro15_g010960.1 Kinesin-like protein KIN (1408) ;mRNA; f:36881-41267
MRSVPITFSSTPPPATVTSSTSGRYASATTTTTTTSPPMMSCQSNTSSPLAHDENDFSKGNRQRVPLPSDPAASINSIGYQSMVVGEGGKSQSTRNNSKDITPHLFNSNGSNNKTPEPQGYPAVANSIINTTGSSNTSGLNGLLVGSSTTAAASPLHGKTLTASFATPTGIITATHHKQQQRDITNNNNTLMTVSSRNPTSDVEYNRTTAVTPRKRDDVLLSSGKEEPLHRYESESSSAMPPVRSNKPTSERARGATPPRPQGQSRSSRDATTTSTNSNNVTTTTMMNAVVGVGPTASTTTNTTNTSTNMPPMTDTSQQPQRRSSNRRSTSPNRIPRVPNKQGPADGTSSQNSSPRRFSNNNNGSKDHQSQASSGGGSKRSNNSHHNWQQWNNNKPDPADHEQALFEQRLCEDAYGVAVRKINQNGKPNLRYVKCVYVMESDVDTIGNDSHYPSSTLSNVSSLARSFRNSKTSSSPLAASNNENRLRVLTWGKKKEVKLPLDRFVCVRKGKTTDRARRNPSPSCRILSLITTDPNHQSLDIEAPTRLDRDKFARAFARFLEVPLVGEDQTAQSVSSPATDNKNSYKKATTAMSEPDLATTPKQAILEAKRMKQHKLLSGGAPLPVVMAANNSSSRNHLKTVKQDPPRATVRNSGTSGSLNNNTNHSAIDASSNSHTPNHLLMAQPQKVQIASLPSSLRDSERSSTQAATASRPTHPDQDVAEDASQVSSLTGAGFDQEIVEELHQALTELRTELEESRAEAARAVKVAEQAIQSAENSSSNDWNSTVTHKAAEAAALAQKRSAEAMAKQRLAEERLEGERRTAAFWRRQAEAAEEEAGTLQTRAAAAEVQRAAMVEELESERRKNAATMQAFQARYPAEALLDLERNRSHESDDLVAKSSEEVTPGGHRRKLSIRGRKKHTSDDTDASQRLEVRESASADSGNMSDLCLKQSSDAHHHVSGGMFDAQTELARLREKLALESAARRKLLHEVQDLRGVVRVYCRPRETPPAVKGMLSIPSQETLLLHPYEDEPPVSFKFDRVFTPDIGQREVYDEIEELCLSVMDGYNICLLAHGQRHTGKTYSLLGNVAYSQESGSSQQRVEITDHGIHLRTVKQLFTISEHRSERYQDTFSLEIVEVHNERLLDLLSGTELGETRGNVIMEDPKTRLKRGMSEDGSTAGPPQLSNSHSVSSKQGSTMTRLEIRTNHNGDTVVQGLRSVEVKSYDEVYQLWQQCLSQRASRLAEQGADLTEYEASSHVIATLTVTSINAATSMGSVGKLKFVDLAGADLVQRRGNHADPKLCLTPESNAEKGGGSSSNNDWKYSNRSLATLNDVVNCRSQFMRSVPYRNSTLTHLLRDNLEADTKVLLLLCVSPHPKDLQETACALRFASGMRRVTIGKATKHSLSR